MKHAILIHADGTVDTLHGDFLLLQPTTRDRGAVVSHFRNGRDRGDASVVCNSNTEMLDEAAIMLKVKRR